jgi:hypothetical protein
VSKQGVGVNGIDRGVARVPTRIGTCTMLHCFGVDDLLDRVVFLLMMQVAIYDWKLSSDSPVISSFLATIGYSISKPPDSLFD